MVLQCINGVGSNPVEGRTKNLTALKSISNTVWFNFQTYIYIYIYIYIYSKSDVCSYSKCQSFLTSIHGDQAYHVNLSK
jgi:hypothetical protein